MTYAWIVAGAAAGAPLRYFVGSKIGSWLAWGSFPVGTLVVNLTGCLAIGLFLGAAEGRDFLTREARLFLVTGLLGSYTTFSAFGWETYALARGDEAVQAALYLGLSVTGGVLAVWAGAAIAKTG